MSERPQLSQLYVSPYAIIPWLNRFVYIGVVVAALVVGQSFWGQFNLLYAVSGKLVLASMAGLAAHEVGAWFGWLRRGRAPRRVSPRDRPAVAVPLVIFLLAVLGSVSLFAIRGIPLFTDPMQRAQIGVNLGPLKRLMYVLLPMSALELGLYSLRYRRFRVLSRIAIGGTLVIFFLLTFKAKLVFFVIAIYLLPYGLQRDGLRAPPKTPRLIRRTLAMGAVVAGLLALYGKYALDQDQGGIAVVMLVRTTVLIAQAPNYILGETGRVPSTTELLKNEGEEVLRFLRLPGGDLSRPMDTEITRNVLGDQSIEAGGLNPTVIGYGWILAGLGGVVALSALYGAFTTLAIRCFRDASSERQTVVWLFTAFMGFDAVQIFSPVGVLLDTGVSILLYFAVHWVISGLLKMARLAPLASFSHDTSTVGQE